jgi:hypothetical protein
LKFPTAVTTKDGVVRTHGAHAPSAAKASQNDITEWNPITNAVQILGQYPNDLAASPPVLRGLPGGRFIAPRPTGYKIISFD